MNIISNTENNKRIAKNTIFLYIRMLILMVVNLYTSRVVLQVLGVEDFGIYNVVGGIVTMCAFLNGTMSGATSRFLTYELGRNDIIRLKETFQVTLLIHLFIALILLLLAETIGLWFVNHKLVIPEERMDAANWVYQAAILTMMIKIIQVPYNASIISNERMQVYAYVEIVNAIVIVGGIYLLQLFAGDKLILYAFMLTFFAVSVLSLYVIYCKNHFPECGIKILYKKSILKPILSFSGWDLYGNLSTAARTQGTGIILNLFFGPILNAANGIASQIQMGVISFSGSVISAFRPQIIKEYAIGNKQVMLDLLNNSTKISVLLFSLIAIPVSIEMPYILKVWLVTPPDYTLNISRIILGGCFFETLISILNIAIHATGRIKMLSFVGGSIHLLTLPLMYVGLLIFGFPEIAYCCYLLFMLILFAVTLLMLKYHISDFVIVNYLKDSLFPSLFCVLISFLVSFLIGIIYKDGLVRLFSVVLSYFLMMSISAYWILLTRKQRFMFFSYIVAILKIRK